MYARHNQELKLRLSCKCYPIQNWLISSTCSTSKIYRPLWSWSSRDCCALRSLLCCQTSTHRISYPRFKNNLSWPGSIRALTCVGNATRTNRKITILFFAANYWAVIPPPSLRSKSIQNNKRSRSTWERTSNTKTTKTKWRDHTIFMKSMKPLKTRKRHYPSLAHRWGVSCQSTCIRWWRYWKARRNISCRIISGIFKRWMRSFSWSIIWKNCLSKKTFIPISPNY